MRLAVLHPVGLHRRRLAISSHQLTIMGSQQIAKTSK